MATSRPPEPPLEWLPSGFPPRSFPPGAWAPPPPGPRPDGGRGGRGWWLAAAAAFLAVLLLAAALLATRGDDDGPDLATGTSTSAEATSVPTFEATTTVALTTLVSLEPVSTTQGSPAPSAPSDPAPNPGPGVLEPSLSTLTLPKTDANAGASQGALTLRNPGATALTYTTQSSTPALGAAPARGTIAPGGSVALTVTLDGARVQGEGAFNGILSFGGTGGAKTVQVVSTVGRPPEIGDGVGESCVGSTVPCSRHIKLATSSAVASPCNTPWLYSVTITDQSRISSARVIARRGLANADAPLRRGGDSPIFQSSPFTPLPAGTVLRFAIEAADEHGFGRRLAEQTIAC